MESYTQKCLLYICIVFKWVILLFFKLNTFNFSYNENIMSFKKNYKCLKNERKFYDSMMS